MIKILIESSTYNNWNIYQLPHYIILSSVVIIFIGSSKIHVNYINPLKINKNIFRKYFNPDKAHVVLKRIKLF